MENREICGGFCPTGMDVLRFMDEDSATLVCIRIPRSDTNEVGEYEVTVSSGTRTRERTREMMMMFITISARD